MPKGVEDKLCFTVNAKLFHDVLAVGLDRARTGCCFLFTGFILLDVCFIAIALLSPSHKPMQS